jgi:serine/threonine protein kinase/Tol biopolymer transport system component
MALAVGAHLGPYEILSAIGAGGMGEVYRAHDTRLDRSVAIKILPAADPDLTARFAREAKTIAALQHPHICTLFDVGRQDGTDYLVLEYLEGQTLATRLGRGPLKLAEALKIASEIADALATAHRAGIVHRDLKPANVMLTKGGAKLLDFGVAKLRPIQADALAGLSGLVTQPTPLTGQGRIVGTLQYMAPEQLEGREADARTDIFAFGAVLYEMLTCRRAFDGNSPASVIAAILDATPPPVSARLPLAPRALDQIVAVCLAKDPDERWQSAVDLRRQLNWTIDLGSGSDVQSSIAVGHRLRQTAAAWILGIVIGAVIVGSAVPLWIRSRTPISRDVTRSVITLPAGTRLSSDPLRATVAISPDGRTIAVAAEVGDTSQLYLRPLNAIAAIPIAGTIGAAVPFFSPDGQWVGFGTFAQIKKVALSGGAPQVVCEASSGIRGAVWGEDGTIFFSAGSGGGLWRVSANGGTPEIVTAPDADRREKSHRRPALLPGGKAVIMTVGTADITSFDDARIDVVTLATGKRKTIIQGGMDAQYLSTGHLVYARAGSIVVVPFDLARLEVTGPPSAVASDVSTYPDFGYANFSVSRDGSLLYLPGGARPWETALVWVDRQGRSQPVTEARRAFDYVSLSPDGQRIALQIDQANVEVWVYDLARTTFTRLVHGWDHGSPVWSPDGTRVTFESARWTSHGLFWQQADGSGPAERLTADGPDFLNVESWSPDARFLVFTQYKRGDRDLWIWSATDRKSFPLLQTPASESDARVSPDGHWIAYQSNPSGRSEVYVRAFPGPSPTWQVSVEGGTLPIWARNGRELFYRNDKVMMAVDVSTTPVFTAGRPKRLFEGSYLQDTGSYDIAPDGRFLMIKYEPHALTELVLVQNWFEELKRRVSTR